MKFYVCNHCGNIVHFVKNKGVPVVCCGEKMSELIPGTSDGAAEKHVPEVKVDGNKVTVTVGSELAASVENAPGAKCPRCWKHSENAGTDDLCPRCAAGVAKLPQF